MRSLYFLFIISITIASFSCAQEGSAEVGGTCEICDAVFESPVPFDQLNPVDTLPDFNDEGPRLKVEGTIYKKDGRTPAKDVVMYIYHTDQTGIYPKKGDEKGYARQHGYLRGWVKTKEDGKYSFYTLRPASYPNSNNPAHIHSVIKEPDKNPYWIDDFLFEDDPYLVPNQRSYLQKRGGNGILKLTKIDENYFSAKRNIILGENIPDYP